MPACRSIVNELQPSPAHFDAAFREMYHKWIVIMDRPLEGYIAQALANFNVRYDPQEHQLSFETNKAALKLPRDEKRGGHRRGGGGRDGSSGGGAGAHGSGAGTGGTGGSSSTVLGFEALQHAFETEAHVAFFLWAFTSLRRVDVDQWNRLSATCRDSMLEVIEVIANTHRMLEHWYAASSQVRDSVNQIAAPTGEAAAKCAHYPNFLSGLQSRLTVHMRDLSDYHRVMLYVLHKCSALRLRRHGDTLYRQRRVPKYTLVRDANGELVCAHAKCRRPKSEHVFVGAVHLRPDHVFVPATEEDDRVQYDTYAWEPLEKKRDGDPPAKISAFVRWCVARHRAPAMWFKSLSDRDRAANEIGQTFDDTDLPNLDMTFKDLGLVLSWKNGVYFVHANEFVPYAQLDASAYPTLTAHYIDAWFHHDEHAAGLRGPQSSAPEKQHFPPRFRYEHVREHLVCQTCGCAADHHRDAVCRRKVMERACITCAGTEAECECTDERGESVFACYEVDIMGGLRGIQTPFVDSILVKQLGHYDDFDAIYFWIFVFLGRYLFPLDSTKYDDWQRMLCFFGSAGTGKSVLLMVLQKLLPPDCFRPLSVNSQETFGLEALIGPDGQQMWTMVLEITGKFRIQAQELQSLISGESMNINRKGKVPYCTPHWTKHMIIAGNAKPSWQDLGFALVRRLFPVYMPIEVTEKDSQLFNRIVKNELDAFVFKAVTAYKYACGKFSRDDLANRNPYASDNSFILPKTLLDFNYTIRTSMNPLWKLIESDLATCAEPMTRHPNMCITLTAFTEQYHRYCRTNFKNMHTEDLTSDVYTPVFSKFNLVARVSKLKWEGNWIETTFIEGIGMTRMYKSIVQHRARASVRAYNERARANNLPLMQDDDYEDGDEGTAQTGNSGPIVGRMDADEVAEHMAGGGGGGGGGAGNGSSAARLEGGSDFWDNILRAVRDGSARVSGLTPAVWGQLVRASAHRIGWDELQQMADVVDGLPPPRLIDSLCHRLETALASAEPASAELASAQPASAELASAELVSPSSRSAETQQPAPARPRAATASSTSSFSPSGTLAAAPPASSETPLDFGAPDFGAPNGTAPNGRSPDGTAPKAGLRNAGASSLVRGPTRTSGTLSPRAASAARFGATPPSQAGSVSGSRAESPQTRDRPTALRTKDGPTALRTKDGPTKDGPTALRTGALGARVEVRAEFSDDSRSRSHSFASESSFSGSPIASGGSSRASSRSASPSPLMSGRSSRSASHEEFEDL